MAKPKRDEEIETSPDTKDEDIYEEEGREDLVEDDEVEPWEEGFVEGEVEEGKKAKCKFCGTILTEKNTVEREIKDEIEWFCSEQHADAYEKRQEE